MGGTFYFPRTFATELTYLKSSFTLGINVLTVHNISMKSDSFNGVIRDKYDRKEIAVSAPAKNSRP